jgi:hypothetical protein
MGILSELRGLTSDTVKVGSLDVPIRGLDLDEWAALERRFPELEGVLNGKAKPSPATMAAIVAPGLSVGPDSVTEAEARGLPAGTLLLLSNAILLNTFPQVRPLAEALQQAALQRATGPAPPAKRSARRSKS